MRPARYVSPSSRRIRKKAAFSALTCVPLLLRADRSQENRKYSGWFLSSRGFLSPLSRISLVEWDGMKEGEWIIFCKKVVTRKWSGGSKGTIIRVSRLGNRRTNVPLEMFFPSRCIETQVDRSIRTGREATFRFDFFRESC